MTFRSGRGYRRRVALAGAAVLTLALAALEAQAPRVPGPPADTLIDVLITFRSLPAQADEALVRGLGGLVRHRYHLVPGMAARLPSRAVAALETNARVARVEPDGRVFAIGHSSELANTWGVAHIGAGQVHHAAVDGAQVTVAVIDSGIDPGHPDLWLNYAGGRNFVDAALGPFDDNNHGTHVAGTIGAMRNGQGVVGVAPAVRLAALKVLDAGGGGSWSNIIAAVQYAVDQGIRVTNNSYGASSNPGSLVQAAFDTAAAAGVLHIAAAGNTGTCGGNNNSVGWPASYASVVAVAAVDSGNRRPCFSSTGPAVELSAPGVAVPSTIPGGSYASFSGTSMASPHVAGLAALLKGVNPLLSATELREILRATARPLGPATQYGSGLIDAVAAVDAARAAAGTPTPPPPGEDVTPSPESVTVTGMSYSASGGPQGNRHLGVTLTVADGAGAPVAGAIVSVRIVSDTNVTAQASGTTGTSGTVTIVWKNAPGRCYTTTVTQVAAGTRVWDGTTPPGNYGCRY